MGGLRVYPNKPDASYEFELIEAETLKLSMHFKVSIMRSLREKECMDCRLNCFSYRDKEIGLGWSLVRGYAARGL